MHIFFQIIHQLVGKYNFLFLYGHILFLKGEFVGLMFDETVSPDIPNSFEGILSKYSVFMAEQGTPTVSTYFFIVIIPFFYYLVWRIIDSKQRWN